MPTFLVSVPGNYLTALKSLSVSSILSADIDLLFFCRFRLQYAFKAPPDFLRGDGFFSFSRDSEKRPLPGFGAGASALAPSFLELCAAFQVLFGRFAGLGFVFSDFLISTINHGRNSDASSCYLLLLGRRR